MGKFEENDTPIEQTNSDRANIADVLESDELSPKSREAVQLVLDHGAFIGVLGMPFGITNQIKGGEFQQASHSLASQNMLLQHSNFDWPENFRDEDQYPQALERVEVIPLNKTAEEIDCYEITVEKKKRGIFQIIGGPTETKKIFQRYGDPPTKYDKTKDGRLIREVKSLGRQKQGKDKRYLHNEAVEHGEQERAYLIYYETFIRRDYRNADDWVRAQQCGFAAIIPERLLGNFVSQLKNEAKLIRSLTEEIFTKKIGISEDQWREHKALRPPWEKRDDKIREKGMQPAIVFKMGNDIECIDL